MANNNSGKKYLKYAAGEILLVMIGILLALQVNNWNERRTARQEHIAALTKLKSDLLYDLDKFENLDSTYMNWEQQANFILDSIVYARRPPENIDQYVVGRGSMNFLSMRQSTFQEMINTGLLYQISDSGLSDNISLFYEFARNELAKVNADNETFYEFVLFTGGPEVLISAIRLRTGINNGHTDWSWLNHPSSREYINFESRVLFSLSALGANRRVLKEICLGISELNAQIDRFLGST